MMDQRREGFHAEAFEGLFAAAGPSEILCRRAQNNLIDFRRRGAAQGNLAGDGIQPDGAALVAFLVQPDVATVARVANQCADLLTVLYFERLNECDEIVTGASLSCF
jgi:hypothetical protein